FTFEQTVRVQAPVDRVWRYLIDPRQLVHCLPGAELTGVEGERTFLGRVKVKVGPVTATYAGRAQLVEVNDAEHVVRMTAEGKETAGTGAAKMSMTSRVRAIPDGGSEVHVDAELELAGKLVQFGRGMIENVNAQLFTQFAACLRARLEVPDAIVPPVPAPPPAAADATRVASPGVQGGSRTSSAPVAESAAAGSSSAAPVRVLPILLRAIWASFAKRFRPGSSSSRQA
ncbi:MAG TPA: SRPBCC family protein, partial [Gemmatimonadaceae bacterium]|nr:SRPBCC family protein [Gemmatimonadaceae bacterium]